MSKKLLYFLLVTIIFQSIANGQGAEFYGNAFWQNANNRIVIRLALRNPTGSSSGQMRLMGMRFGFQYNAAQVTYAGFQSYMTGLNDASSLSFIGPDTAPNAEDIDLGLGASRTATVVSPSGTKTMQLRYINRSTLNCNNGIPILAGTTAILLDIYFTLNSRPPSYYHLTDPDYGFGDNEFIAQFLHKFNGGHTGNLTDQYKEIVVTVIRQSGSQNPYQPFDASNCLNSNFNPITIGSDDINFITPINGVLSGKIKSASGSARNGIAELNWDVENNNLVDRYEIERKDASGNFKTVALILSDNNADTKRYNYKDKLTNNEELVQYRIKAICVDGTESVSSIVKVNSKQSQSAEIRITPNPVTNFVQMQLPLVNGSYACRVYNSEGRMVLNSQVLAASSKINVDQLAKGTYFLEAYHPETGNRYFGKFSKQ